MLRRRLIRLVLGLFGAVAVLGVGIVVALVTVDLRPIVEHAASRALDRDLTIGALRIHWGNPLEVELHHVRLANMRGGSATEMLTVASLAADIDVWALLRGVLRYDRLRIEQPQLLLERNAAGAPNWHFRPGNAARSGGLEIVPKDRTQFPTLRDFALHGGALIYRVPQHKDLNITVDDLTIRSAGDDQPVALALNGAYNGLAARLSGTTGPFATMRNGSIPYPADFSLTAAPLTFDFKGALTEPLDFEGLEGRALIDTPALGELLKIFGTTSRLDVPLHLTGTLGRTDNRWHLADTKGALASSTLTGSIDFAEGARGQPDMLNLDLALPALDLTPIIAGVGGGSGPGGISTGSASLRLDDDPGVVLVVRIAAQQLVERTFRLADVALEGQTRPGAVSVRSLSFAFAGGKVTATGSARSVQGATRIDADTALMEISADQLLRLLGAEAGQVAGRLDGRAAFAITGATLNDALHTTGGQAVLAMTTGRIASSLVEKASTDLRALFRTSQGSVAVSCLLGAVIVENGVATVSPLRLRTPDTTFVGGGTVDLTAQTLDLTVKSQGAGPSLFALEVPLRVDGPISGPAIRPVLGSTAWLDAPTLDTPVHHLAPALRALVAGNPCLQ